MANTSKSSTLPLLRWAHPLGFAEFLRQIGTPVESHLQHQGLPTLCEDPNAFLPVRKIWAFWAEAAHREDPMLGWHVGRRSGDNLLSQGMLQKLENAPTLYLALQQFIQLIGTEASHLRLGILERRNDVLFYTHYPDMKDAPGYEISQTYQLEVFLALIRHYLGPQWLPEEISVEAPCIPGGVQHHFPCTRIVTGNRIGYLAVPRSALHIAGPAQSQKEDSGGHGKDSLLRADQLDDIEALKILLKAYLAEGYPSATLAASLLDTSVRTLIRRLSVRGLSYSSLVDQVRFDTAKELLEDPGLKVAEIGAAIGFDDHSHFTRMFRRVGGLTPRQYRGISDTMAWEKIDAKAAAD